MIAAEQLKDYLLQHSTPEAIDTPDTQSKRMKLSPKALKLLKKKQEADKKLEKEIRDQEPVDLIEDQGEDIYAEPPTPGFTGTY